MKLIFKILILFEFIILSMFLINYFIYEAENTPKEEWGKGFVPNNLAYSLTEPQINFSNVTFVNYSIEENLNR